MVSISSQVASVIGNPFQRMSTTVGLLDDATVDRTPSNALGSTSSSMYAVNWDGKVGELGWGPIAFFSCETWNTR